MVVPLPEIHTPVALSTVEWRNGVGGAVTGDNHAGGMEMEYTGVPGEAC